jgi:hypothetical protein
VRRSGELASLRLQDVELNPQSIIMYPVVFCSSISACQCMLMCTFVSPDACCLHAGVRPSLRDVVRCRDGRGMARPSSCVRAARSESLAA